MKHKICLDLEKINCNSRGFVYQGPVSVGSLVPCWEEEDYSRQEWMEA